MLQGIYLSAAGGMVESAKTDVIANNLANASTPGFQREMMTFTRRDNARTESGDLFGHHPVYDAIGGGTLIHETYTDLSPGKAIVTGEAHDMSIQGNGFFAVTDGQNTYYTRAGNFQIDPQGFLATADGRYRVLDASGSTIAATGTDFQVASNGTIEVVQDGQKKTVGRVGVFDFVERADGPKALSAAVERYQDSLLRYLGEEPVALDAKINGRSLEQSGVNPVVELSAMIQANRAYEANLNMIRAQDGTLQQLISQVGRVPS